MRKMDILYWVSIVVLSSMIFMLGEQLTEESIQVKKAPYDIMLDFLPPQE